MTTQIPEPSFDCGQSHHIQKMIFFFQALESATKSFETDVSEEDVEKALNELKNRALENRAESPAKEIQGCIQSKSEITQAVNDFKEALKRHNELKDVIKDGTIRICVAKEARPNTFVAIQALPANILKVLQSNVLLARHHFRLEPNGSTCRAKMGWLCGHENFELDGDREHVLYLRLGRKHSFAHVQDLHEFTTLSRKRAA